MTAYCQTYEEKEYRNNIPAGYYLEAGNCSQSLSLAANVGMNYALSSDFCVEDKGCRGQGISAKIPCQIYTKYHGSKLPIFITRGAYK